MTFIITTPPAVEPVTLDDARAQVRVASVQEDELLTRLIGAARQHVERTIRRALITQGWRLYLDDWPPGRVVRLPVTPVQAVTSVTVFDAEGMPVALDAADYDLDGISAPARLKVKAGAGASSRSLNGIEIELTAGYGDAGEDVPAPLRQAILLLVAHWFEHREAGIDAATASIPFGFDALVAGYRVPRL
ncbi:phage head-tail connector protein [Rhizobiales bacterium]|uniref:head-tail connector protein n=1 Tax=Hongsoonwoonella zoysiae TaxID=2821844 RepID=UPI0015611C27|nr:head-tail connector protein [Hongsoonwoonella zoysiae]NRG19395.1 phage head-tail connector protein [Hongsoonwoonella zoysiae]